jgi:hypothetical protein
MPRSAAAGAGRDRIRGLTSASRLVGRFCFRCPRPCRRVCVEPRGWGDRAGIPGRAFRRGGGCGLLIQRDWWTPLPDLESELRSPRTPQGGGKGGGAALVLRRAFNALG